MKELTQLANQIKDLAKAADNVAVSLENFAAGGLPTQQQAVDVDALAKAVAAAVSQSLSGIEQQPDTAKIAHKEEKVAEDSPAKNKPSKKATKKKAAKKEKPVFEDQDAPSPEKKDVTEQVNDFLGSNETKDDDTLRQMVYDKATEMAARFGHPKVVAVLKDATGREMPALPELTRRQVAKIIVMLNAMESESNAA